MSDPSSAHKPYTTGARPFSTVAQKIKCNRIQFRMDSCTRFRFIQILVGTIIPNTTPEVLVAIRNLAARLTPVLSGFTWLSPAGLDGEREFDKSVGGTLSIVAHFSQEVVVTGSPTISVTNGNQGSGSGRGPDVLVYASGTTTEELTFSLVVAANSAHT